MTYYELAAIITMLFFVFSIAMIMMIYGFVEMVLRWQEPRSN